MISRILVPTDGSKTAQKAAKYAIGLAKQFNAAMIILSVVDTRSMIIQAVPASETTVHIIEPLEDYLREAADTFVREIQQLCENEGIQSKTLVTMGHPVDTIVHEAEKAKADLIVMSSRGKSALSAVFLGSVTYGVIHKDTKIPIVVFKE
jgi:nucleotide-binding universal stress UspA family protein